MLRKMHGPRSKEVRNEASKQAMKEWRKFHNAEISDSYFSPNTICLICGFGGES